MWTVKCCCVVYCGLSGVWHAHTCVCIHTHTCIHTCSGLTKGLKILGWSADDLVGEGMEYVEVVLGDRNPFVGQVVASTTFSQHVRALKAEPACIRMCELVFACIMHVLAPFKHMSIGLWREFKFAAAALFSGHAAACVYLPIVHVLTWLAMF